MPGPPEPLTAAEQQRLRSIVERDAPHLGPLIEKTAGGLWLTDDEAEALVGVLVDVFLAHLDGHDDPDGEGVEADNLLGRIVMQRREYWSPDGLPFCATSERRQRRIAHVRDVGLLLALVVVLAGALALAGLVDGIVGGWLALALLVAIFVQYWRIYS